MDENYIGLDNPEKWIYFKSSYWVTWWVGIAWREIGIALGMRGNEKYNGSIALEFYFQFLVFYGELHVTVKE